MRFSELQVGMVLKDKPRQLSYLIYGKTDEYAYMIDVTSKRKYLPWDKVDNIEWADRLYPRLEISKNRFDLHNAIIAVFEITPKLEDIR